MKATVNALISLSSISDNGRLYISSKTIARDDTQQRNRRTVNNFQRAKSKKINRSLSITSAALMGLLLQPYCSTIGNVSAFSVVKYRNSVDVERIIFGTAALNKVEKPLELLDQAYEKGFRRFDLARTYGGGESERIFGEWIKSRGVCRDTLNIITKGGMGEDKYGSPTRPLLTEEGLQNEVKASLEALQTDTIDLYMFHRDDPRIPVSTFVRWANRIVDAGHAKSWGVSNWSFDRFRQAYHFATLYGYVPPSGNSPQFSLAIPRCDVWPTTHSISDAEHVKQIEWYETKGIELICWEVLAKGFMAKSDLWPQEEIDPSTFDNLAEEGTDEWRVQRLQRAYCTDENYRRRDVAKRLAESYGCELSQVAAMYPLSVGKHISVIFGSSKEKHLSDMIDLEHLHLDDEAMFELAGMVLKKKNSSHQSALRDDCSPKSPSFIGANNVKKFVRSKKSLPVEISGSSLNKLVALCGTPSSSE